MGVGEDGQQATWAQDTLSSSAGAVASITVAQPLDVVKVRNLNHAIELFKNLALVILF